jgi:hypothetical protein
VGLAGRPGNSGKSDGEGRLRLLQETCVFGRKKNPVRFSFSGICCRKRVGIRGRQGVRAQVRARARGVVDYTVYRTPLMAYYSCLRREMDGWMGMWVVGDSCLRTLEQSPAAVKSAPP